MDKIAVVMSSYNGEKFIDEQIKSILNQNGVSVELFIRDDGSKDNTIDIINLYENKNKNVHLINRGNICNAKVAKSFLSALKFVYDKYPQIQFFSFSDQDDYWLPEKLRIGLNQIKNSRCKKGALYYSNKVFVDSSLNEIEKEHQIYYGDYLEILWKSLASGCTMVFNRKLLDYLFKYEFEITCLHDAWLYRLAKCIGTEIYFGEDAYILYRQHENNVCGQKTMEMFDFSSENIIGTIKRRLQPREHAIQSVIKKIYCLAKDDLDEDIRKKTEIVMNYNTRFRYKVKMLFFEGIEKRNFKMKLLWINKVMMNMI